MHLLAGVSYYKVGAAHTIDLGTVPVRPGEIEFLRAFYLEGLGEFAYENGLDLRDLAFVAGAEAGPAPTPPVDRTRPLVPFGGGIPVHFLGAGNDATRYL